ncbi:EAL domain-containing protein [Vibrio sp. 10N.261.46.A3]|uniref:EAL domain-containing response regulator n=1 Tax=Vibrio sp. 10N.261.46.A3 TaxID=3229658 RepID=UPI00354DC3E1
MQHNLKVMIVEDDLIQSTRLKIELNLLGIDYVFVAQDGIEALDLMKHNSIDLIFCDINMPNMDGIKLLLEISEITKELGVVIVSSAEDDICDLTLNISSLLEFSYSSLLKKKDLKSNLANELLKFTQSIEQTWKNQSPVSLSAHAIHDAFKNGQVINYYQPKVSFDNQQLVSVEALARVKHPIMGILSPISFMDTIDECNMMDQLFFVVLNQALCDISACPFDISVSVNMTQENLEIPNICDKIIEICKAYSFPHEYLTLELTESQAYRNRPIALATLARLRVHGFKLSIDDFGTGYASLDKLLKLPFTEMKIDRSFISDLASNPKHQVLVKMLRQVADTMGMNTVTARSL